MGYERIDVSDLDPLPDRTASGYEVSDHYLAFRDIDGVARPARRGPTRFGFRVYHAEPGEGLGAGGMHYHEEQEELFFVVEGTLHVETPDDTYVLVPGQALFVEPESPQRAYVPDDADEPAYVIATGAPSYRELGRNDGVYVDSEDER